MARIRRIKASDVNKAFATGEHAFDYKDDGSPCDIQFYFNRDISGEYEVYVIDLGERIGGVLCLKVERDYLHISRLGIESQSRGKGYAKLLHQLALKKAIAYGKTTLILQAHRDAIPFFETLGWRVVETYDDDHWGPGCAKMAFDATR